MNKQTTTPYDDQPEFPWHDAAGRHHIPRQIAPPAEARRPISTRDNAPHPQAFPQNAVLVRAVQADTAPKRPRRTARLFGLVKARRSSHKPRFRFAVMAAVVIMPILVSVIIGFWSVPKASALSATARPNGDVTAGWPTTAGTSDGTCSGTHCTRIDESTLSTTDYVATGTAGSDQETEVYTMDNPLSGTDVTMTGFDVRTYAQTFNNSAAAGCNSTCDTLSVSVSTNGGTSYSTTSTVNPTGTATLLSSPFTGTLTDFEDFQVRIVRNSLGGGSPSAKDDDIRISQMYVTITYQLAPTFSMSGYRWFNNADSLTASTVYAAQNTAATGVAAGQALRLRLAVHIGSGDAAGSTYSFRLQYAPKVGTCDTSHAGEVYENVERTTPIAYNDNPSLTDETAMTASANDPSHSTHSVTAETYEESNYTHMPNAITAGNDAKWDFSLKVASDAPVNDYCLRLVQYNHVAFATPEVVPEIQMSRSVSAIAPDRGPTGGGTQFKLTGVFAPDTTVTIGGAAATNVFVINNTTLIGTAPAGTVGAKDIVITSGGTTSTLTNGYTYASDLAATTRTSGTDFSAGTLTNLTAGTISMTNGNFQWKQWVEESTGGSIAAGTYYYVVTALDASGNESTQSVQSRGVATAGSTSRVILKWMPVPGARGYKLYRSTTSNTYGASSYLTTVSGANAASANQKITYIDTAVATTSGTPPSVNNTNAGLRMPRGTVPNSGQGTMGTGPTITGTAANATGAGAHFIERTDGKYLLVMGNATSNTSIYDPGDNSFTAGPATTAAVDWGGHAVKRKDGLYIIVHGNKTSTSLYDPASSVSTAMTAGPALSMSPLYGGHSILRNDGDFLVVGGNNSTATSLYKNATNTFSTGPTSTGNTFVGSNSIKITNDMWLTTLGGSLLTNYYHENANSFTTGPNLSGSTSCNSGCRSLQRPDGSWLVIHGTASTATTVFDPVTLQMSVGPVLPGNAHDGVNLFERPDGTWLVIRGNSSAGATTNTTYIYDPVANSFSTGPNLTANASAGSSFVQRPNGTYIIVHGNGASTSSTYDAGWLTGTNTGTYVSEAIRMGSDANAAQRLVSAAAETGSTATVEARFASTSAGLASASYILITDNLTLQSNAQQWVQIRITVSRVVAAHDTLQSVGVWGMTTGATFIRRFEQPSVTGISVLYYAIGNNKLLRHGEWFDDTKVRQKMAW